MKKMTAVTSRRLSASIGLCAGLLFAAASAVPAAADVDDFDYSSWDARYELSLDDDGRAVLQVQEHVVAEFPETDQNKGIIRGLATRYAGADLATTVLSVTDAEGNPIPYETDEEDDALFVLTGTDDYVHGPTDYVISYEMRDVLLTAEDTGTDEFFWDLLPLDSTQDIGAFRAEILLDAALAARLTGDASCYQGAEGSTTPCEFTGPEQIGEATSFTVQSGHRAAEDGVTIAIGFEADTVTQPAARHPNAATDVGTFAAAGGAVAVAVGGWFAVSAHRRRSRQATGIVVAQYDVPASMPPLLAAALVQGARAPIAAEILHLAVTGQVRIEHRDDEPPVLHRVDGVPPGDDLDARTLGALFPDDEAYFAVPDADETFAGQMQTLEAEGVDAAAERGLTTRTRSTLAGVLALLSLVPTGLAIALAAWSVGQGRASAVPAVLVAIVSVIVSIASIIYAFAKHKTLTPAGAREHEYLQGVREFIRVAEADRIQMLQSFSGAERYTRDGIELIHLYERLLPYAVLFGMESEWARVLESRYAQSETQPDWLQGYQAGFFVGSMAHFGQSTQGAAHYSAPSTTSSSSFSGATGGGFSGGGGGGGFSGGR